MAEEIESDIANNIFETYSSMDDLEINKNNILDNKIKILYTNIRSVVKYWDLFNITIDNILDQINVISIVEINIKEHQNTFFSLPGFRSVFCNRVERRGGGIVMFIREGIKFDQVQNVSNSYENIHCRLEIDNQIIHVITIYRQPDLSKQNFIEELEHYMYCIKESEQVVIIGDINIDTLKNRENIVMKYENMMASLGYFKCVHAYTRYDMAYDSESCIDHIFCKVNNNTANSAIIYTDISDHCMLLLGILGGTSDQDSTNVEANYKYSLCKKMLMENINSMNWNSMEESKDSNEIYNNFCEKINTCYNKSKIESSKIKIRKNNKPWFNEELKIECKNKERLYKRWKNCKKKSSIHDRIQK